MKKMNRIKKIKKFFLLTFACLAAFLCGCERVSETGADLPQAGESAPAGEVNVPENNGENVFEPPYHTENTDEKSAQRVTLMFGGDVTLSDFFNDKIKEFGYDYPLGDVAPLLENADISFFNLETSVGTGGSTRKPEGYGFRSPPENLNALMSSGVDFVTCANNHILDFGTDVFQQTMTNLGHSGIAFGGIGNNIQEAAGLTVLERNEISVGFLSFSAVIPFSDWKAGENSPGLAPLTSDNVNYVLGRISESRALCDLLVINVHWGAEYTYTPNDFQKTNAHKMIDAGADIIVGHHPHVLQGIEFYNGRPIFYSIGNFLFFKKDDSAGETALFRAVFDGNGNFVEGDFVPMYINACATKPAEGDRRTLIINSLQKRSEGMNSHITDDCKYYGK